MLLSYFLVALRQLKKNKLYAAINILGLTVGLTIFILGTLIVRYERSHDLDWQNADRIFTVGTLFGPSANVGIGESDSIYTGFTPFIDTEVDGVEAIARIVGREFLVSVGDSHYYQRLRFADPQFLDIFDFDYVEGNDAALDNPLGVVITEGIRDKIFGPGPALGKSFELDHNVSLHIAAVIKEIPKNTHFASSIISDEPFEIFASLEALNAASDYDLAGNFNNLSMGDKTYIRLAPGKNQAWLQASLDGVFERHYPEDDRGFISGLRVRPLVEANTLLWDAIGLPLIDSVQLLSIFVLIIAIVNYTNLATAQSLGRAKEIGLRKTMGATRGQLITQFVTESICVAAFAMLLTIFLLLNLIPAFNAAADKGLAIDWFATFPFLLVSSIGVGILAGAYPAFLISKTMPIDALRDGKSNMSSGSAFRTGMLILQFSISILMLGIVAVVFLQNDKVARSSEIYPKEQVITLSRLNLDPIRERFDALHNQITRIPGVVSMSYSSHIPYEQSNSGMGVSAEPGNAESVMLMNQIWVDEHFLDTLNIPLLAGRNFDHALTGDFETDAGANVLVNELALQRLGFNSPSESIGQVFYEARDDDEPRVYTVVGVIPDQNFQGFHNVIKPTVFKIRKNAWFYASIKLETANMGSIREQIENTWQQLVPDYPIQSGFLVDEFNETYEIYTAIVGMLGGFAFIAMTLSLIGLFGLAAFMAASRTKEIGVRKVMGASTLQITRLLIWRFSRPVLWALLIALPLAYLGAQQFVNFFADRIELIEVIVLIAGIVGVAVSCLVVSFHAVRVAQTNPIVALRHD